MDGQMSIFDYIEAPPAHSYDIATPVDGCACEQCAHCFVHTDHLYCKAWEEMTEPGRWCGKYKPWQGLDVKIFMRKQEVDNGKQET